MHNQKLKLINNNNNDTKLLGIRLHIFFKLLKKRDFFKIKVMVFTKIREVINTN